MVLRAERRGVGLQRPAQRDDIDTKQRGNTCPRIVNLTDAETWEVNLQATARCYADWWPQVSCRQIRNALDRARR
jgi:hypothetical protein